MSLRLKLILFLLSFIFLTLLLGFGTFYIFDIFDKNIDVLETSIKDHTVHEEFHDSIVAFLKVPKDWALTGDPRFKRQFREQMEVLSRNLANFKKGLKDKEISDSIENDIEELKKMSKSVISSASPVGNVIVLADVSRLELKEADVLSSLEIVHRKSLDTILDISKTGEDIKKNVKFYLSLLISFGTGGTIFVVLLMRRTFGSLFNELLVATEKVSRGDLTHRIGSRREDEFGTISKRFDEMVERFNDTMKRNVELYTSTKDQLQKLTVLYELGKTVASVMDLDELLRIVALEISKLLNAKGCIIRLLEDNILRIKSSYGFPGDLKKQIDITSEDGVPSWVVKEAKPLLVKDISRMPPDIGSSVIAEKSLICLPLQVGGKVIGTLGLYDKIGSDGNIISFSDEDMDTVTAFALISAVAIEKARIYESERLSEKKAVTAKNRMEILFDSVQGGIVTLGKNYEIISVNTFIENWINKPVSEMIGKSSLEVFHEKEGICPHCVAKATYETGQINTITQSRGVNHAELTSYPIKDKSGNVIECVVFIQDITERVLYHEEILGLYKEVAQTKDYLESLIDNSADAIVTSDLSGVITSWNQGAERIFAYTEVEAVGKFLPFVPQFLIEAEMEHMERIKKGETLKDIETLRQKKDGMIIEVSLTLSPIKDTAGEVIGISGISRDISERKRVEKELMRRNQELSRLFFISSAMRGTFELDKLLRMVLTAVTMSDGLGFNRSILFLVDEKRNILKGAMGVGPANPEEAWQTWEKLSIEKRTLPDIMLDIETSLLRKDSFLDRLSIGIEIPLEDETVLSHAVKGKKATNVLDVKEEPLADVVLIQQIGTQAYAAVPLISRDKVIGALWVDNFFTRRLITEEDMKFLAGFANQVASAIESVRLFEQVSRAEAELENIFRSISDMIYITDKDYTIKNINKAVADRVGKPAEEIIGRKCYKILHGMNEPFPECPHHKTVNTMKAYIEEVEDKYLGGTFLTSSSPVFDSSGEFSGTVHVVRDITELNTLREKLVASERMAALGEVAAKVAHEIRNPLVSVGGFARILERKLEGNLKDYAGIIAKEVNRLETTLKEILGFVKEARLAKEKSDINKLVKDIISLIETEVKDKGIMLVKELGFTPLIMVDPYRIREALLNILNNALQAVVSSGAITVKTYTFKYSVVIEISDTGPGIDEKDLPFIFNPFYTTKAAGTGLGLSITNRIIEEHKGKIEVESKIGKGTTFKVFLPLKEEGT
ncbi:MAG: PAS domain S-box protein [Nitrospirae bacterium]|nr:PAS domain S-box protein [Nitrospirota bacterium]